MASSVIKKHEFAISEFNWEASSSVAANEKKTVATYTVPANGIYLIIAAVGAVGTTSNAAVGIQVNDTVIINDWGENRKVIAKAMSFHANEVISVTVTNDVAWHWYNDRRNSWFQAIRIA